MRKILVVVSVITCAATQINVPWIGISTYRNCAEPCCRRFFVDFFPNSHYYCSRATQISECSVGLEIYVTVLKSSGVICFCHGHQPPLYKYSGIMENSHRDYAPEDTGGLFFVKLSARMFCPLFSRTVYCPSRRGAWRLQTEPFDYRAAQHSGALVPRSGPWFSRSWVNLVGDLALLSPAPPDTDIPDPIT